jgi:dihydroneopterin aldolase
MDIIYINELKIDTVIGIYEWERRTRQTIVLNIEMGADIKMAASSDDIKDTLDYKAISKRISSFVSDSEYKLVETLIENVAEIILSEFGVPWCKISLNKPGALRGARDVGVIIERGNLS